jgi:thiol-disulfide isomerase/thioredoxin
MKLLETQAEFETLWFHQIPAVDNELPAEPVEIPKWIVYFTASWCKACKKLDLDVIQAAADSKKIQIYKCDETQNTYTSGYCGIRSFPTFMFFMPKTIKSSIQSSDTNKVVEWIQQLHLE